MCQQTEPSYCQVSMTIISFSAKIEKDTYGNIKNESNIS